MAFSKTTFNDLKLSLAYRYGETAIPSSGDSNRNFWLNKAVQYMANKIGLVKKTSLTVSSGSVSLPDDFVSPVKLKDSDDSVFTQVDQEDYDSDVGNTYTIEGNQTDGWTLYASSDGTYTLFYKYRPEDMSSNSDVCVIPDGEAVVAYAYGMLRKSETDPLGDAGSALQEAESRLAKMIRDYQETDKRLTFTFLK